MCIFSQAVEAVSATSIFARGVAGGRQVLVYGMTLAAHGDLAMVLPIPVPPASADDAVRFIDMSGYPRFFAHMNSGFPARLAPGNGVRRSRSMRLEMPALVVHDVGAFEASFVPTIADFGRLDARFRLPAPVWDALPGYRDHGFAVFKLKGLEAGAPPRAMHPMAFRFPRRDPYALFFPTVHIHDGAVHPTATFDHTLYCQTDAPLGPQVHAWQRSEEPAAAFMRGDTAGLVDPGAHCLRRRLEGTWPNRDVVLDVG